MDHLPSEPSTHLPWGPKLSSSERMVLAQLTGYADRLVVDQRDTPVDDATVAALLEFSDDPRLWGVLLGQALRRVELGESAYARLVEVARAVGADEEVANMRLAWLRATPGV